MISKQALKHIRNKTFRADYPTDEKLISAARSFGEDNIYLTIISPITHLIYNYLTEFIYQATLANAQKPPEEIKILDWGGGKGYATYFLSKKGITDVTCFETEDYEHTKLWKEFNLKTKLGTGDKLPFKDKEFDAVIGLGVLEHVPYDYEALKELNRILKDDGLFFCFNLPNKRGVWHKIAHARGIRYHDRLYSRSEVKGLLKRSGFNTIGKPWFRQILPKNSVNYPNFRLFESLDLALCKYTPVCFVATSIEFVARKQEAYTSQH